MSGIVHRHRQRLKKSDLRWIFEITNYHRLRHLILKGYDSRGNVYTPSSLDDSQRMSKVHEDSISVDWETDAADPDIEETLLEEEIRIDGICGVY